MEGKNFHNMREVASLTKIMTLYVTLRWIKRKELDPTQITFKVSAHAAAMKGTSARLQEGMWVKLSDLYYALMLPSGNDAATVIAENMGGVMALRDRVNFQYFIYDREFLHYEI